jgi:SAM-dependent methyltransferase
MMLADHQRKYTGAIHQARQGGLAAFQTWFNRQSCGGLQQCLIRGYWDFSLHILTPSVCVYIERPEETIALEIGYGGGRMLNAACNYFQQVIGIDIHAEQATVATFLRSQNKDNFLLLRTSGDSIDVASNSIDFIYSFIVLQHLPAFSTFVSYLQEAYRCLKPGGVAQLYFGKFARLHPVYQISYFLRGYRENPQVPANHISLVIRPARVRHLCHRIGFTVVDSGTSFFRAPDGYPGNRGGQHYVTLVKAGARAWHALS